MSEIKGQLLGLLLVLTIFGVIGGGLMSVFTQASSAIEERVDSEISLVES